LNPTPRQLDTLRAIVRLKVGQTYPTFQQIADYLGVAKVTVYEHCRLLMGKGLLACVPHKSRAMTLTTKGEEVAGFAPDEWVDVRFDRPDVDTDVLIFAPGADPDVWVGYLDGETWRNADGTTAEFAVTHWRDLPNPPVGSAKKAGAAV
jgi:DNA-binding transcriptional MocR family regulator